jgi:tRNA(fMet)-specific endonuclease VapC
VREEVLDRLVRAARVLEVTDATSRHYAAIRHDLRVAGTPIPVNDTWIAALARQHALPVLSNDTHFDAVRNIRRMGW